METPVTDPLLKGSVRVLDNKPEETLSWTTKFFVLWGYTERTNGRLEIFPDADWYRLHRSCQASVNCTYLEEVDCVQPFNHSDVPYAIVIARKSAKPITFACFFELEFTTWFTTLKRELARGVAETLLRPFAKAEQLSQYEEIRLNETDSKAEVKICETAISRSCQLQERGYHLTITQTALVLQDTHGNTITAWHYKNIRRYGRSKRHFFFESGSKCALGQGWWKFAPSIGGEKLFQLVSERSSTGGMDGSDHIKDPPPPKGHRLSARMQSQDGYVTMSGGTSPVVNNYATINYTDPKVHVPSTRLSKSDEEEIYVLPSGHKTKVLSDAFSEPTCSHTQNKPQDGKKDEETYANVTYGINRETLHSNSRAIETKSQRYSRHLDGIYENIN